MPPTRCRRSTMSVQPRRPVRTIRYAWSSRLPQFQRRYMLKLHLHVSIIRPIHGHYLTTLSPSYANITVKQPCAFELSTYQEISAAGIGFTNNIVRDNCQTAFYFCDTVTKVCELLRSVGQQCQYHRDCQSVGLDFHD